MVYARVEQLPMYYALHPLLQEVHAFAASAADKSVGRYELSAGAYALIKEGQTKELPRKQYEGHRRYWDVHVLISGSERIDVCNSDAMMVARDYNAEKDNLFFDSQQVNHIDLLPGEFCLCMQHDAHEANLCASAPSSYRKIVFKLPVYSEEEEL